MSKKITLEELKNLAFYMVKSGMPAFLKKRSDNVVIELVANNKGNVFTFGEHYFYRHGKTEANLEIRIRELLSAAGYKCTHVARGNNHSFFQGGAKPMSTKDSFWWVTLIVEKE